jgi:hypothetical protein
LRLRDFEISFMSGSPPPEIADLKQLLILRFLSNRRIPKSNSLNPSLMPIEVRELVIKAVVTQDGAGGPPGDAPQTNGNAQEEIIQACVEKVMDILKEKNER